MCFGDNPLYFLKYHCLWLMPKSVWCIVYVALMFCWCANTCVVYYFNYLTNGLYRVITLGHITIIHLQSVLKPQSSGTDENNSRYTPLWMQLCVFAEVTWIGGVNGLYHLKESTWRPCDRKWCPSIWRVPCVYIFLYVKGIWNR